MNASEHLIVRDLSKEFVTPEGSLKILSSLNLTAARGESMAIVGPSGCGKSTLLHILGTLDTPSEGSVQLDGVDPFQLSSAQLAVFRNQRIGFIFQEHHLLPQLSALENVLIPKLASGSIGRSDVEKATQLLVQVGLADRVHQLPARLSGGERQRVAVARSLVCDPVLILADEPTGSLDQNNANTIGKLLLDVHTSANATLLCVTHSPELASMFGRTLRLNHGQLEEANQLISGASQSK